MHLTVDETLRYTAELRMPASTTPEERVERINWVLEQVRELATGFNGSK